MICKNPKAEGETEPGHSDSDVPKITTGSAREKIKQKDTEIGYTRTGATVDRLSTHDSRCDKVPPAGPSI